MQIIYRADSIIDANLVKAALEDAGVMAFVNGAFLTGAAGELPVNGLVSVMVADFDVERAQPIVDEVDEALRADVDPSDRRFFDLPDPAPG
jgi:malonyl CoA-acyl carrier protein transacylase